jgi:Flp pilus assembly protein TadD
MAWVYFFEDRYDSAMAYIRKNEELNPDFFQPYRLEGLIYLQQGKGIEALKLFQKAVDLSGNNPEELAYLGYAYARLGNGVEAEKIIAGLKQLQGDSKMLSFPIAMVYAGYQDKAKTFEYLEMARRENTADIMLVDVFPQFDFLKMDDEYENFERETGIIYLE